MNHFCFYFYKLRSKKIKKYIAAWFYLGSAMTVHLLWAGPTCDCSAYSRTTFQHWKKVPLSISITCTSETSFNTKQHILLKFHLIIYIKSSSKNTDNRFFFFILRLRGSPDNTPVGRGRDFFPRTNGGNFIFYLNPNLDPNLSIMFHF